jgi:hypothetical protein
LFDRARRRLLGTGVHLVVRAVLESLPPAGEDVVNARRADDRPRRDLEMRRVEDEGTRLGTAHPAVEADQLLEGAAFVEASS